MRYLGRLASTAAMAAVAAAAATAFAPASAYAAWLSTGSGSATAAATSVNRANAPTPSSGSGTVLLTWSASTLASGDPVGSYDVVRQVGTSTSTVCSTSSTSCTDDSPLPGPVRYGVVARIGADWVGPVSPLTDFTYDDVAPATTITTSPAAPDAAGWFNDDVTVTLTATDPGPVASGVKEIHYTVDGGSENVVSGDSTSFTVSQEQVNTITYWAVDAVGNIESPTNAATVKLDKTAPVTTATLDPDPNAAGWDTGTVTVTLGASDNLSGVALTEYSLDGGNTWTTYSSPIAVTSEGSTTVSYRSTDAAGNVEPARSTTVQIDKTAPTSSISPASGTVTSATITATDNGSGVASIVYQVDGGAPVSVNAASTPVSFGSGSHTVTYHGVDLAGNVESDHTATFNTDNSDTLAPTVTVTYPGKVNKGQWDKGCGSAGLCGTAVDNTGGSGLAGGSASYELRRTDVSPNTCWNGSAFTPSACGTYQTAVGTQGAWNIAMPYTTLPQGTFELRVKVTDIAGNSNRPGTTPAGSADVTFTN